MIYISGKITGNPNFKRDFEKVELFLQSQHKQVINPVKIIMEQKDYLRLTWKQCMSVDVAKLILCDEIFMMKNWRRSPGARIERKIARLFGIKVIYEK